MRLLFRLLGLLCFLLPWPLAMAATSDQAPTIEQSLSMKLVSNPHLSPDGRYVVYQERTSDWERNVFITQLWIAVTATRERYQLTTGDESCLSPAWSPDGRRLAFLSDRGGQAQIYLIAPDGGEGSSSPVSPLASTASSGRRTENESSSRPQTRMAEQKKWGMKSTGALK